MQKQTPENSLLCLFVEVCFGIKSQSELQLKVAFNQDVKCIKPDVKNTNSEFLLYWFSTNEHHLMNMVTGTGIGAGAN